ncbi:hypothetical protein AC1031_007961 [Aphanomyces cochlioides]|nr:hypothetical protein AC1031_020806 [Aphanomyces cochlioides]KAG9414554.1 hypothetical protein AC1031_007961 [Aphanomyces cochlioides]
MLERLSRYKENCLPGHIERAEWLQHREAIRSEVLVLPSVPKRQRGTKRVVPGARMLSLETLQATDTTTKERQDALDRSAALKKRKTKSARQTRPKQARSDTRHATQGTKELFASNHLDAVHEIIAL